MLKLQQHRTTTFSPTYLRVPGLLISLVLVVPLMAGELENVNDVEDCRAIENKAERLLCYDTVVDGGVFNEQQLKQAQVESFGSKDKQAELPVDRVTVTVTRVSKTSTGIHYFYTADGAAWKQSSSGKWNIKAPFEAEIKSGMLGSFFLISEGGKSVRVKRVK